MADALRSHEDDSQQLSWRANRTSWLGERRRYELLEPLGSGAMGSVCRARDRWLGRAVAIKHIHAHLAESMRFTTALMREARASAGVDHPNVARTLDFGREPDGRCFIVMELLEGKSLADVLAGTARPPIAWTLRTVSQVLSGLAAVHDRGVVHRDVKPENVMLEPITDDDGNAAERVKLCDFGIARVPGMRLRDDNGRELTFQGKHCGTPGYMAPELFLLGDVDHRGDLYSVGVMLHEMTTGEPPLLASELEVLELTQQIPVPRPPSELCPGFDPALERVILRALEPDPDVRYQNARQMRADLMALLAWHESSGRTMSSPRSFAGAVDGEVDERVTAPYLHSQDRGADERQAPALPTPRAGRNSASQAEFHLLQRQLRRKRAVPAFVSACLGLALMGGMAWQLSPQLASEAIETLNRGMSSLVELAQP